MLHVRNDTYYLGPANDATTISYTLPANKDRCYARLVVTQVP